ncbi:MAG: hypothetical protein ACI91R_002644, partial [Vicingaceae bacterium]
MDFTKRAEAFFKLGEFLNQFTSKPPIKGDSALNKDFFEAFSELVNRAVESNGWFTKSNVTHAISAWANCLDQKSFDAWLSKYDLESVKKTKTIGMIAAGNIPLVGFHDVVSVLISGHKLQIKLSKKDHALMFFLLQLLQVIAPEFKDRIEITEGNLNDYDAVIATGSGNSARYFEYYFGQQPNIIRKNRNSIAIITGNETPEELKALGEDVFRYYGLGCRNVSKIYIPEDYNLEPVFLGLFHYKDIIEHKKYENNYDYNKAVFMMSQFKLRDNGFIVMKEDSSFTSPIGALFYETYTHIEVLKKELVKNADHIQCIV